jgi:hypothetical protein
MIAEPIMLIDFEHVNGIHIPPVLTRQADVKGPSREMNMIEELEGLPGNGVSARFPAAVVASKGGMYRITGLEYSMMQTRPKVTKCNSMVTQEDPA